MALGAGRIRTLRKYACCTFFEGASPADAAKLLQQAEVGSLDEVISCSGMEDGMTTLGLCCGSGLGSVHYAAHLPNSCVPGVSNSLSLGTHILADTKRKELTKLDFVTCDMSKAPFVEQAAAAFAGLIAARRGGKGLHAAGNGNGRSTNGHGSGVREFDRVDSLEVSEHMKNCATLLKHIADVCSARAGRVCLGDVGGAAQACALALLPPFPLPVRALATRRPPATAGADVWRQLVRDAPPVDEL